MDGNLLYDKDEFGRPKNYNERNKLLLRKEMRRYTRIYNRTVEIRRARESTVPVKTKDVSSNKHRMKSFVTPAPNRYQIKRRDYKQTGNKGPSCFTGARDKTSYYGQMATKVGYIPISKNFYYNLPSTMQRLSIQRNHFVMKIRNGSRASQKTYMRSMLQDLTLCPKDPNLPGPDKYYPQNFSLKKKSLNSARMDKTYIFHPGAYIPQSKRFTSMKPLQPGPGRYNPQPIACPCKCGSEYREDVFRVTEYQQWKFSPFYANVSHLKVGLHTCDAPKNIPGKELTSVFKSNTKRLIEKSRATVMTHTISSTSIEKVPMMLDLTYIHAIREPKRKSLSLRVFKKVEDQKLTEIKFNTTAKTLPRTRLRTNGSVAFMSSCPRFDGGGSKDTFLANRNLFIVSGKSTLDINANSKTNLNSKSTEIKRNLQRLLKLPQRYMVNKANKIGCDKIDNLFPHMPEARILLKEIKFAVLP